MTGFIEKVKKFARDTRSALFSFRKDTLDPIVAELTGKTDAIMKLYDVSRKTEQLLLLKKEVKEKLSPLDKGSEGQVLLLARLSIAGLVASVLTLGSGAALASMVVCTALVCKFALNGYGAMYREQVIDGRLDREILDMANGPSRDSVFSVPQFQQALIDKGALSKVFSASQEDATGASYRKLAAKAAKLRLKS